MIRFSRSEDYAFILVHSLANAYKKRLVPLSEIAKKNHISILFLRNLANQLRKADVIGAVEGKNGGYFLKQDPSLVTMGEILHVFSPNPLFPCCPVGEKTGTCDKSAFCETGVIWRRINRQFLEKISAMSIADFIKST